MQRVLIVDDEVGIRKLLTTLVNTLGSVTVDVACNGLEALERAREATPDLIISDINMPSMDGLSLVQAIRADATLAETHFLLLTARGDSTDRYEGLSVGADDYVVKPFDPIELQLRIKTLLRRSSSRNAAATPAPAKADLVAGAVTLDPRRSTCAVAGVEQRLTTAEFSIMRHLAEHPDQLVTVAALLEQALGYPAHASNPAVIHTHMRNIRAKLREGGIEPTFLSSSRQGYMLITTP